MGSIRLQLQALPLHRPDEAQGTLVILTEGIDLSVGALLAVGSLSGRPQWRTTAYRFRWRSPPRRLHRTWGGLGVIIAKAHPAHRGDPGHDDRAGRSNRASLGDSTLNLSDYKSNNLRDEGTWNRSSALGRSRFSVAPASGHLRHGFPETRRLLSPGRYIFAASPRKPASGGCSRGVGDLLASRSPSTR